MLETLCHLIAVGTAVTRCPPAQTRAGAVTHRVITLFRRVHLIERLMIELLALLETMSRKEYQEIRLQLGNGSSQESLRVATTSIFMSSSPPPRELN